VYGSLAALYSLMQFLFAPVLGSLSDRFGRRTVILSSLLGSGLDTCCWFCADAAVVFPRAHHSRHHGANITATSAYIADVSPPEKRRRNSD